MSIEKFGDIMKAERLKRGLTQKNLADLMKYTGTYISKLEWGHNVPVREKTVVRFADALQLDAEEIMDRIGLVNFNKLREAIAGNLDLYRFVKKIAAGEITSVQIKMLLDKLERVQP